MGSVDEEVKEHSLSTPDIKSDPQPSTSCFASRMNFTNSTYEYVACTCGRVMQYIELGGRAYLGKLGYSVLIIILSTLLPGHISAYCLTQTVNKVTMMISYYKEPFKLVWMKGGMPLVMCWCCCFLHEV